MTKQIEIENVGPVRRATLPFPEGGGVVVLKGRNGSGKTTALRAVHALAGAKEDLTVRDGEVTGDVVGLGASLHLSVTSKRAARSGELEVHSLGSEVDPSVLVDPGLKDPEAADMRRARVLCFLAGVEPRLAAFHRLLDAETVERVASAKTRTAESLPELAAALKRDIEAEAREAEAQEEQEAGLARALMAQSGDLDLNVEDDEAKLRAATEAALGYVSEAKGRARGAKERAERFAQAKSAMDAAAGVSLDEVRADAAAAGAALTSAAAEVTRLRAELAGAEAARDAAQSVYSERARRLQEAEAAAASVAAARAVVEAGLGDQGPTDDEIAALERVYQAARAAQERGTLVRQAKRVQLQAQDHIRTAQERHAEAERLRGAASGCWDVVAEAVARIAPDGIRFDAGRLVLQTERGLTYFADLSEGERWKLALPACIRAVGEGGILPIRQEAWEGLDPINRQSIVEAAKAGRVAIYTAEATDGELRAEIEN